MVCWREIFYQGEAGATDDYFTRSGLENVPEFVRNFFLYRWGVDGTRMVVGHDNSKQPFTIGFKFKYQQAQKYPQVLDYLREDPRVKVIHLVRGNLLASLVSSQMVPALLARFNTPNVSSDTVLDGLPRSIELSPLTVLGRLERLEASIASARREVANFPVLEISYENLVDARAETCRSILEFLEVDPEQQLFSAYRKIMPPLKESIHNIDEIQAALKGTRFENLLL